MQKESEELKKQGEEIKDTLKRFGEKLKHIEAQFDDIRRVTFSLERVDVLGSYDHWPFDYSDELYLIPCSKVENVLTELNSLDVTVTSERNQAMASVRKLLCETERISVTKNLRFPSNGDYFCVTSITWEDSFLYRLYNALEKIDYDCYGINSGHYKGIIFRICTQTIETEGWASAQNECFVMPEKTPTMRLEKYLWSLCLASNFEKRSDDLLFGCVFNVISFECKHYLRWKYIID